jgi:multiple sugar transport system ATP-binding protein
MAEVRFEEIRKTFGKVTAVNDVSLHVGEGEFVVLLGPSGCGKTTLLRCLAGLERVDSGRIYIGDREATDLPPRRRRISMVFQSYAVFPHLKVRENIAFGLRRQKEASDVINERVDSVSELLGITELLDRYPSQISGGQRQRVAVARAIAIRADVLLMDEPLSNLDALLRLQMRAELKALLRELGATTIYVTHDQTEALSMGDRIAVMQGGRIVQLDSPLEVYDNPKEKFVGDFVGTPPMNFLGARVETNGGGQIARLSGGALPLEGVADLVGRELLLGIRAEAIAVQAEPGDRLIRAAVVVNEPLGSHNLVTVRERLLPRAGLRRLAAAHAGQDPLARPGDRQGDRAVARGGSRPRLTRARPRDSSSVNTDGEAAASDRSGSADPDLLPTEDAAAGRDPRGPFRR